MNVAKHLRQMFIKDDRKNTYHFDDMYCESDKEEVRGGCEVDKKAQTPTTKREKMATIKMIIYNNYVK